MTLSDAVKLASSRVTYLDVPVSAVLAECSRMSRLDLMLAMTTASPDWTGTTLRYASKADLLTRVRMRLTAISRAMDRAEV